MRHRGFQCCFIVSLVPVLAWMLLAGQLQAQEPRYQGRTFSEWQADLKDLSPKVREKAADALGYFGARAVPVLVQTLRDPDDGVWVASVRALVQIGPAAVPAMVQALKDTDYRVRVRAAIVLGDIGLAAKDAVPALIQALGDNESKVRFNAAGALGKIGPEAKDAVPALTQALRDERDYSVRMWMEIALREIEGR